jgi:hypothetical protein
MFKEKALEFCKRIVELEKEFGVEIGADEEGTIYIQDVKTGECIDWMLDE